MSSKIHPEILLCKLHNDKKTTLENYNLYTSLNFGINNCMHFSTFSLSVSRAARTSFLFQAKGQCPDKACSSKSPKTELQTVVKTLEKKTALHRSHRETTMIARR